MRGKPARPHIPQATPELQARFATMLDETPTGYERGDIIPGRLLSKESNGWLVDIRAKMPAMMPNWEIGHSDAENLVPGQPMDMYVMRLDAEEGYYIVSRKRVYQAQVWQELETIANENATIEAAVVSTVKGGLLVDIKGLRGFVPSSHIRHRQPLDSLVGETLPFKILSLDATRNNIILSHRKVMSEQMADQRKELFDKIQEGTVLEGEVVRLTDFGAFVDLGGVDGLLPLSQISWRWVEHPSDVLNVGETVRVEVIGMDPERHRVSLSIKSLSADPWTEVDKHFAYGQQVDGTITKIKHFGAFVEIYPGIEALLPSKDMLEAEERDGAKLDVGTKVKSYIVKFNPDERRIGLSIHPEDGESGGGGGRRGGSNPQPVASAGPEVEEASSASSDELDEADILS